MSKLPVCNIDGSRHGEFELSEDLLELKRGGQAVHEAITAHRAKCRAGTASTLKRGEVSGGGAKPYRQKGTGRARAGSNRSPIWRGGGIIFGPKPRDFEKVAAGQVMVIEKLDLAEPKTHLVAALLRKLKAESGALLVDSVVTRNLAMASRNMENVKAVSADSVHTYQLIDYPLIVVTRSGMEKLAERLKAAGRVA
jgi:large subunit ribosomal protein L4